MTKTTKPEKTLADLKPGDPVVYNFGARGSYDEIKYVERMTKTLVILKKNGTRTRFKIRSGRLAGRDNSSRMWGPNPCIKVVSVNEVTQIQDAIKARRLSGSMSEDMGVIVDALDKLRHFSESKASKAQLAKLERLSTALGRVADIVREFDPSFKLHPDDEQDDS